MEGKVFVDAAEASNEVVFVGTYCAFGGIATVNTGWYQLEVDILLVQEGLEGVRALIVKALEQRAEAGGSELGVQFFVGCKNGLGRSCFDGLS